MDFETNPYAPPAAFAPADVAPESVSQSRVVSALAAAAACLLGSLAAGGFAIAEIESIVASGPALLLASIVLAALAYPAPLRRLTWISGTICLFVVFVFLLINLNGWGPRQADRPVGSLVAVSSVVIQVGWILVVQTRRHIRRAAPSEKPRSQNSLRESLH